MKTIRMISLVPYKILPARMGGEKGIALFNEYFGALVYLVAIGTRHNDSSLARNYTFIKLFSTSRSRYANLFLFFRVRRLVALYKGTHLMIEHPYYGWLGAMVKRALRIPLVVHSHNIEYMRSRSIGRRWWRALKWYEQMVYRQADMIFFISDDDRRHAIRVLKIDPVRCATITYGVERNARPADKSAARNVIAHKHGIAAHEKILLFNGALYHHSNYDAVTAITQSINPLLLQSGTAYKIVICGKGLPPSFRELKDHQSKNIIYAGFVDDIDLYFEGSDIFLNPIMSGGGIKTKAIEALAMDCTVISTEHGAIGIRRDVCGDKLKVVADGDWNAFAAEVIRSLDEHSSIPDAFFQYYFWGNIARKAVNILATIDA